MALARGVYAMLAEHWDALEGDWSIYHHRDLVADCFGPAQIGVRRLLVFIEALPRESSTARVMKWWTDKDEQSATQVEVLGDIARSSRQLVALQLKDGRYDPGEPALTWPRPWVEVQPQTESAPPLTRAGMRASFMGGM